MASKATLTGHPESFRVVGFFDEPLKWHGTAQIKYFEPEDCFEVRHIPSDKHLREYATLKGYPVAAHRCEAVYTVLGDGLGYCNCTLCFPSQGEFTDNRVGVGG